MSTIVRSEKIDIRTYNRETVEEPVAMEVPINIFVNDVYVVTLLTTPKHQKELALGWLFTEKVLRKLDEVKEVETSLDYVKVITKQPIDDEELRAAGVSRIITTACALSASKFLKTISGEGEKVKSKYKIKASEIAQFAKELDKSELYKSTKGVHVAALFEEGKRVAFAEDIGRHNSVDKVVGIAIQSKVNFANSVLVSSGRQPADMVLKAARMGIPVIVSIAGPIRSGIITAEKTSVTLVCFVKNNEMKIYTHADRILTN